MRHATMELDVRLLGIATECRPGGLLRVTAPLPDNEPERLEELRGYAILDSPAEAAYDDIVRLATHICAAPIGMVSLIDEDRQWFKSVVGVDATESPRSDSFCAHAILDDDLFVVMDAAADRRFEDNRFVTGAPYIRFSAGAPLRTPRGCALGTLCVIDRVPRVLSDPQREALRALGRQVSALLELRRQSRALRDGLDTQKRLERRLQVQLALARSLNEELERGKQALRDANDLLAALAQTDPLTGMLNRRALSDRLAGAFALAAREGLPLSVVMIDVDHFKAYNDAHGHPAGDEVLRRIASILGSGVRESDVVARYGGEEFLVLLPATDAEGSRNLAERLRAAIETSAWPLRSITASLGVSTINHATPAAAALVEEADRALYQSKRLGRNRVTHHHAGPPPVLGQGVLAHRQDAASWSSPSP